MNTKENKAITLISLVITIVILIILSSVGIYLSLGNNGIFNRAKQVKETTNKQTATEIINLKITTAQMNKYSEEQRMPTLKELSLVLKEDNEIQYVTEQSKKRATVEYNVPSEQPSSIYTKLKEYPYEFEINSSLQLASINGIKIAQKETVASKRTKLLKEPVNTNTKNTDNNMDITLEDSIEQYTYLEIQVDMNGAQNSGYFGEKTFIIATEQLEYNDNDTINYNNESLFIIRCYGSGSAETYIHCWFKNNNTLHIGYGCTDFTNINTMRIRNVYGIK